MSSILSAFRVQVNLMVLGLDFGLTLLPYWNSDFCFHLFLSSIVLDSLLAYILCGFTNFRLILHCSFPFDKIDLCKLKIPHYLGLYKFKFLFIVE